MRIVLATPLYPPEIAAPAPYIKELAARLSSRHQVTMVAYARIPERVGGVEIISVDKQQPLLVRLVAYTRALLRATRSADVVYAVNGASVELPVALTGAISRKPLVFGIADPVAHHHAEHSLPFRIIERIVLGRSYACIKKMPRARPEILPFEPHPADAFVEYEASWREHLAELEATFNHGKE